MSWHSAFVAALGCVLCATVLAQGTDGTRQTADVPAPSDSHGLPPGAGEREFDRKREEFADAYPAVLRTNAADLRSSLRLGTALLQNKRYREALEILGPLRARLPDDAVLKNNIAWIYAVCPDPAVRNPGEAVKLAQQAILAAPGDADIWNTLAEAHYAAGEHGMAQRAARIAVALVRETAPARVGEFWETLRRCDRAVEHEKR